MFEILTKGFQSATLKLKGQAKLTEENIAPALDEVKRSLLDADVDLKVVKEFLERVRTKTSGSVVTTKSKSTDMQVSAGDHFVQACYQEILDLLGGNEEVRLQENPKGPTVVMLVGLQGSGKTTHAAKLARLMQEKHKKRPLLIAADVYRPAARDQLKVLGERIGVPVFTLDTTDAVEIATKGLDFARSEWRDLVIIDTAGRLTIDDALMNELEAIKAAVNPQNNVLIIDSMIGQDAVRTASAFNSRLNLSGVILTKLDGDTRGGAALSVKTVTGKNILFIGTGENLDKLEEFRAEGMASRILGMGDVLGLMEDFSKVVDEEQATQRASRLMEGHFDFNDFLDMTKTIQKMGPLREIVAKTPFAGQLSENDMSKLDDREMVRMAAMVHSMTNQERENPDLLLFKNPGGRSRVARIAKGSARSEKEVKDLVERFMQMRQMVQLMSGFGGGGLLSKIPGLGSLTQMSNMAKAMRSMGGGLPGMGGMPGMGGFPGAGGQPRLSTSDLAEINRLRKRKKEEKRNKQKKR